MYTFQFKRLRVNLIALIYHSGVLALKTLNTFKEPIGSILKAFLLSNYYLAASVSSRSLVVCPSVGRKVVELCEKLPLEYQILNKTFLRPTYLPM